MKHYSRRVPKKKANPDASDSVEEKEMRPRKPIDWKVVDHMLEAQCSALEIAGHFGMTDETLYDRVKAEYGMSYTNYSAKFSSKGLALLRMSQFQKAVKGNAQMQVWLGKQYLKQSESPTDNNVTEDINTQYNELMTQLKSLQSDRNIEDTNNITDTKS